MEHLHHFQLSDDPFRNEPLMRLHFENGPQDDAQRRLERAVRQARGLAVLVGETGSGKTVLVRRLLESLEEEVFEASMMVVLDGAADAGWMLRRFAVQLGVEEPAAEREGLIAQIYECLAIVREDGRHAVLIIDDAQALAEPGTLAEICGLLKLEYEDRRLLSLVLAGSPALDAVFTAHPHLANRIDVRVRLAPLSPGASAAYLAHRIRQADGDPGLLHPGAVAALHEMGGGYPGRMNTLADNALFEAFLCGRRHLSRLDVERAHRDLGWKSAPGGPAAHGAASLAEPVEEPVPDAGAAVVPGPQPASAGRAPQEPEVTGTLTDPGAEEPVAAAFDDLDEDLDAIFDGPRAAGARTGPPKDDDPDDLLVELVEE